MKSKAELSQSGSAGGSAAFRDVGVSEDTDDAQSNTDDSQVDKQRAADVPSGRGAPAGGHG